MTERPSVRTQTHQILAVVCFGLFAGAMALNGFHATEAEEPPTRGVIWNTFQYGMPILIGGLCLTGKRWAFMTAIIYGTIGLALDIATLAQSLIGGENLVEFFIIISTTAVLNFLLIMIGGRKMLQAGYTENLKGRQMTKHNLT